MDAEVEYYTGQRQFDVKTAGNGDTYADGEAVTQYVQFDIQVTPDEFEELRAFQDGTARAGNVTLASGVVLSVNGAIADEFLYSNGVVTLKLAGSIKKQ
jgi:hypothetical protein